MRIVDITLDRLRLDLDPPFHATWSAEPCTGFEVTLVRVHTDAGLVGVGSGDTMAGFDAHRHLFLDTDPFDITRQVRTLESLGRHGAGFWPLEAALWDIIGKATGQPLATLFGRAERALRACAATGSRMNAEERVESALNAAKTGFRALKLRVDAERPGEGIEMVRAVRDALGDSVELMVALDHRAPELSAVRDTMRRLAELDVIWVEDPLSYGDTAGLRTLREGSGPPIAAAELPPSTPELLSYLESGLIDVYHLDVVRAVGLHRARTLAELARLKQREFVPHAWTNGIGLLANLHVAAGVGGCRYFEFPFDPPEWTPARRDFMLDQPLMIDLDGDLLVPAAAGLGVRLDEAAVDAARLPG